MLCLWLTLLPFLVSAWAPPNPFLCDSAWPIVHHDSYSQGSTNQPSITYSDVARGTVEVDWLFDKAISGTLSIYWSSRNNSVAWGSGVHAIFKIDTSTTPMTIIDAVLKPRDLVATDVFRGIYSVVSNEGTFYSAIGNLILACTDSTPHDPYSKIKALGAFELDEAFFDPDESIMSLNILYTGEIAFLTNKGKVGVANHALTELLDLTTLAYNPLFLNTTDSSAESLLHYGELKVSNSMTIDQHGGLYVVSSKFLHRLFFDSKTSTLHSVLPNKSLVPVSVEIPSGPKDNSDSAAQRPTRRVWATPYETESEPLPNRLSREGSGTSPTIFEYDNTLFVTICDGLFHQNILVMEALTGKLVASAPVNFGALNQEEESYTEQSILVHEAEMVVVQNALTSVGKRLNQIIDGWDPTFYLEMGNAPNRFTNHATLAPVVLGDSSRGLEKFRLIGTGNGTYDLKPEWATTAFGCPNAIPTMSAANNILYCVGKGARTPRLPAFKFAVAHKPIRQQSPLALPYPEGFEGGWVISGIDWVNGTKLFDLRSGFDIRYNSVFAAVQIGPKGEIIYGSMGGIVRARKLDV
eukprot:Gregarina_sp_Pseudo_9__4344@NODE_44_length_5141_cov_31_667385_g41_i0_p1_GENE_NODE_44_length_5141_cov_31_667385_g41_i0NODE_44_length_5141_cov_31_667385_g41_i0_p1_ORF_typecomplete_len580_score97_15SGL/PF08450_12/0_35SGL/PF08450_12/3e02_NODE_44_length_5141_cov_31_667385_g41_i017543493